MRKLYSQDKDKGDRKMLNNKNKIYLGNEWSQVAARVWGLHKSKIAMGALLILSVAGMTEPVDTHAAQKAHVTGSYQPKP